MGPMYITDADRAELMNIAALAVNTTGYEQLNFTLDASFDKNSTMSLGAVIVASLFTIINFSVIVVGNSLIIAAVVQHHYLRTPCRLLIANLALADCLVGAGLIPYIFVVLQNLGFTMYSPTGMKISCLFAEGLLQLACGASYCSMFLIALDRYCSVAFPMRHIRMVTAPRTLHLMVAGWAYSGIWVAAMIAPNWNSDIDLCTYNVVFPLWLRILNMTHAVVLFILTTTLYARLFVLYTSRTKEILQTDDRQSTFYVEPPKETTAVMSAIASAAERFEREKKRSRQIAVSVAIITALFFLLWMPFFVVTTLGETTMDYEKATVVTFYIASLNSGTNPFVYAWKVQDFRDTIKKMITCQSKS